MVKSKFIQLLKTLSTAEFKEYGKVLETSSHRKTSDVFLLFNYLKKLHPDFPEKKLDKELVLKKVFKSKTQTKQKLSDLMSALYILLEDFLIQKKLEAQKIERDFLVLSILKDRKLDKLFFQKAKQIEKDWNNLEIEGIEHLHNTYKLHNMSYLHPNFSTFMEDIITQETLSKEIDNYYFASKLYNSVQRQLNQRVANKPDTEREDQNIIDEILNLSEKESYTNIPQIHLFSNIIKSFYKNDFSSVAALKEQFSQHLNKFNQYEKYDTLHALIRMNYANHFAGVETAAREMFELNKFAAENMLVIEDGFIESEYFKVIVDVGCTVSEIEWTENFITQFSDYLKPEFKEYNLALCNSLIEFEKGNYEKVLENIAQVKFENIVHANQIKSLQLQCYYELDDYDDLFHNLIRSFSSFLKRDKQLSQNFIVPFETFIKYCNKLYLEKHSVKASKNNLFEEISGLQSVIKKRWLLKKAQEQ